MFSNKKLLIAVVVVLIVLIAAWYYRSGEGSEKFDSARENFESNQADMNSA